MMPYTEYNEYCRKCMCTEIITFIEYVNGYKLSTIKHINVKENKWDKRGHQRSWSEIVNIEQLSESKAVAEILEEIWTLEVNCDEL